MARKRTLARAALILQGGELRTGSFRPIRATALATARGRLLAVGRDDAVLGLAGSRTRIRSLAGGCLLPGFVDPHLHFRALVRRKASLDCSAVADGGALLERLAAAARERRGDWLFAHGLEHRRPGFGALPRLAELDRVTGDRPLWLRHRGGHMSLFNGAALRRLGCLISPPPRGWLEREAGRPTGVGYEMAAWVAGRLRAEQAPPPDAAVAETARELLRAGVTAFADLTATNHPDDLPWWEGHRAAGRIPQRVRLWVAPEALAADRPFAPPEAERPIAVAGIKVLPERHGEGFRPAAAELARLFGAAARLGWPVAVHAVEHEDVAWVLEALRLAKQSARPARSPVRLEHLNAVAPPLLASLAPHGLAACVQPGLLREHGALYRETVPIPERGWLFPLASLKRHAAALAIGSDAPAGTVGPLGHAAAAVSRRDRTGRLWRRAEKIPLTTALAAITSDAASVAGFGGDTGRLTPGAPADAVVFAEPWAALRAALERGEAPAPIATLVAGRWFSWR